MQTAIGASTLAGVPFTTIEPTRSTVASDGSVWTASTFSVKPNRAPQSRFVRYDPATGKITGQNGVYLGVRLNAVASNGPVADDKTAPKATFSGRVLARHTQHGSSTLWTGLRVKVNEGGQTVGSLRLHGRVVGFGLATVYEAGSIRIDFGSNKKDTAALRKVARAHGRAVVHLTVHDWAGNKHVYDRAMRLSL